ncbi:MAG: carbohydrate ABC transporter permease, partial [Clostridiales bacterium]|nr:carbohydrate ABC transporter permease [Clostridiales bacterium]
ALYPMYYVLVVSLSDPVYASTLNVYWWPKSAAGIYLGAYTRLVTDMNMWNAYRNTVLYTAVPTGLMVATCTLCAYPLSSPKLLGRKVVNIFLLVPMYFGGGLIPTFLLMTKLRLYDNIWAMIIPASFNIWYIILTRTYFASIPEEMREAARIDGANNYQCMGRIYLPNAKPILAVIAIYTLVARWNSWYDALLYLPNTQLQPLQLYLRRVLVDNTVDLASTLSAADMEALVMKRLSNDQMKYAMIIFTTLPIIFAYPFLQRYFVKGVMVGSLKG